jgi:hypothetical protein
MGLLGGGAHSDSGLKLVIKQHPLEVTDDTTTGGKHHRRQSGHTHVFGVVDLDLAEYASPEGGMGKGGVKRRYLMKQGKTNATVTVSELS